MLNKERLIEKLEQEGVKIVEVKENSKFLYINNEQFNKKSKVSHYDIPRIARRMKNEDETSIKTSD